MKTTHLVHNKKNFSDEKEGKIINSKVEENLKLNRGKNFI